MNTRWQEREANTSQAAAKLTDAQLIEHSRQLVALVADPSVTLGAVSGRLRIFQNAGRGTYLQGLCEDAARAVGVRITWRKNRLQRLGHGIYNSLREGVISER